MNLAQNIRHFKNNLSGRMSEIIFKYCALESQDFFTLLKLGAIYVNDERILKDKFIAAGNSFRIHLVPRRYNYNHPWKDLIVFENDFCLVLNKPSGVPSHATIDNFIENALTQTSLARNFPLYITHRLDTLTSGLIVYAKKSSFAKSFNHQLQERKITKKYVALVESAQTIPARLTHYMDPAPGTPKKLSDTPTSEWQPCELEVLSQKKVDYETTWVKVNLLTGRTHQIRAQFAKLGAPVAGDTLYGAARPLQGNGIALRSCEIEFDCQAERLKFNLNEDFTGPAFAKTPQ